MPRYKNTKPSILGLSSKATSDPQGRVAQSNVRTVQPGEVFEANADEIPQVYLDQKWLEETQDPVTQPSPVPGTTGQYEGSNPVQQSNTSALESATDKSAQQSGAYDARRTAEETSIAQTTTGTGSAGTTGTGTGTTPSSDETRKKR